MCLTPAEEQIDSRTGELRFNIDFLAERLIAAVDWARQRPELQGLNLGLFGASTGAAAALVAAATPIFDGEPTPQLFNSGRSSTTFVPRNSTLARSFWTLG